MEVAEQIEEISGEALKWDMRQLSISSVAWNRIIHGGIKPIVVFAHPAVLVAVDRAVSYYRMLSMASQKSMNQVGLPTKRFETSGNPPNQDAALAIARRLNQLISALVESEARIAAREFDLWRGMAAGSQAQGSWQNRKGDITEELVRRDLLGRLHALELIDAGSAVDVASRVVEFRLQDGRMVRLGSEPDIQIYSEYRIHAAVEVKGGIDAAGVLERVGAAIKSLSRAKEESPGAITILIMSSVSMSRQARRDIESNRSNVNYLFTIEDIVSDSTVKEQYYSLLGLGAKPL